MRAFILRHIDGPVTKGTDYIGPVVAAAIIVGTIKLISIAAGMPAVH